MNFKPKVCILDYGSGNQNSVSNFLNFIGVLNKISREEKDIVDSTHLILPGVGSYLSTIDKIIKSNLIDILNDQLFNKKKLFLGICVGMQVLTEFGYEFKKTTGLKYLTGKTVSLKSSPHYLPHIGWNNLQIKKNHDIFKNINEDDNFYFVNSFKCEIKDENVLSTTTYNEEFTSVLNKENIYGFQFHPEKSQNSGIKIMKNFLNL